MPFEHPAVGICGLSCRLCPSYHTRGQSRCGGCKSTLRMGAGCPFITCAVKRKGIAYCWQCGEQETCARWRGHRAYGQEHDTFVSYQRLEHNIAMIQRQGLEAFVAEQEAREALLVEMLEGFNEGRSKRYYCIAATVLRVDVLQEALARARRAAAGLDLKGRSRLLHGLLDAAAEQAHVVLKLRK